MTCPDISNSLFLKFSKVGKYKQINRNINFKSENNVLYLYQQNGVLFELEKVFTQINNPQTPNHSKFNARETWFIFMLTLYILPLLLTRD